MAPKTTTRRAALSAALLVVLLGVTSCASSEAESTVRVVGGRGAVSLIDSGDYVVLDLRPDKAFVAGHVKGARSVPFLDGDFKRELPDLDPGLRYLLYAQDSGVARRASDVMVALDFEHVVDAGPFGLLALAGATIE